MVISKVTLSIVLPRKASMSNKNLGIDYDVYENSGKSTIHLHLTFPQEFTLAPSYKCNILHRKSVAFSEREFLDD